MADADAVLQRMKRVIVAASGQARQQFIECRRQQLEHARGVERESGYAHATATPETIPQGR